MAASLQAFFRATPSTGQRLYLHHTPPPGRVVKGAVVYVHPWAEEMNKSRRMASLAARALAADGWAVLQVDLMGCGDSSGDFGDASWQAWTDDVVEGAAWLARQHPAAPLWLWGLRAGALLAGAAIQRLPDRAHLLLWQPVSRGKVVLQQFLRLKAAAHLGDGQAKATLAQTRNDLAAGRPAEIAGYMLSPALARGLEAAELAPPTTAGPGKRVIWLEVTTAAQAQCGPAAQAALAAWQAAGWQFETLAVTGPPFWQTVEIEDAPALVDATVSRLAAACTP